MKNLAQIIYGAYPEADLLPIDPVKDLETLAALHRAGRRPGQVGYGDGLFSFIVAEATEAEAQAVDTEGGRVWQRRQTLGRLAGMLDRAIADLDAVRRDLEAEAEAETATESGT